MSDLSLKQVHRSFGQADIIKGIDLDIPSGELVVFVGPSGCGKSTLLRMISGLESVSAGQIFIHSRDVTHVPPAQRGVAMVFQSYALFPHMTVGDNITFGLRLAHVQRSDMQRQLERVADILQIQTLLERYPRQLSGGQRQRVAIGRAIIRQPQVFLFDEPLSNLDAELRVQMRLEFARLHARLGATMVYVTHDQVEAMTLATRMVVLNQGRIEQVGTPLELYRAPANRFVAQFIGSPKMNVFAGQVSAQGGAAQVNLGLLQHVLGPTAQAPTSARLDLGVRPEALGLGDGAHKLFDARVEVVERLGDENIAYVSTACSAEMVAIKLPSDIAPHEGEQVAVCLQPHGVVHVFDHRGQRTASWGANEWTATGP